LLVCNQVLNKEDKRKITTQAKEVQEQLKDNRPNLKNFESANNLFPKSAIAYKVNFQDNKKKNTILLFGDSSSLSSFYGISKLSVDERLNFNILNLSFDGMAFSEYRKNFIFEPVNIKNRKKFIDYVGKQIFSKVFLITSSSPSKNTKYMDFLNEITAELKKQTPNLEIYHVLAPPKYLMKASSVIARPFQINKPKDYILKNDYEKQTNKEVLKSALKNVTFIDSTDFWCPDDKCHILRDGLPLTFDDYHLSKFGSELQAKEVLLPYLMK
jgi:hypothetical protein